MKRLIALAAWGLVLASPVQATSYLSRTTTIADGVQKDFPVSFPYEKKADVNVYVHSVSASTPGTAKVSGVDYSWTSSGVVTFVTPPASTLMVDIRRSTSQGALPAPLSPGGSIRASDLNADTTHLLYLIQELADIPPSSVLPTITLTGDVTGSGSSSFATSISASAVDVSKMASIATSSFIGRTTAGTGSPEVLTGTQATAMLNPFSSSLKGLVPASGGGSSNYLRADGLWAAPAGGGGGAGTTTNALTVNTSGGVAAGTSFDGSVARTIDYSSVGAAKTGAATSSTLTMATGRLLGRTTAATGALEEITPGATMSFSAGALGVTKVPNANTFNNSGAGAASGTTFDGSAATTISYNTLGAAPLASPTFTGVPAAPTASVGTSTTQLATTAFVQGEKVPSVQTLTSSATVTPTFTNDAVSITALAGSLALANWTGTPADFWSMVIRIKDNGTARAISYGTNYSVADGVTAPTTTIVGKTHELAYSYNATTGKYVLVSATTY